MRTRPGGLAFEAIWRIRRGCRSASHRLGQPFGGPAVMRLALYQPDIPQNTGTLLRMAPDVKVDDEDETFDDAE